VDEQYTPYVRPQENGYKCDTRWFSVKDEQGSGLLFVADSLLNFSAIPYSYETLASYEWGCKHLNDPESAGSVDVNIDLLQMGLGGDDSWGAEPHQAYMPKAGYKQFSFSIIPLNPGISIEDQLKLSYK
jgi:beta-galactosidase